MMMRDCTMPAMAKGTYSDAEARCATAPCQRWQREHIPMMKRDSAMALVHCSPVLAGGCAGDHAPRIAHGDPWVRIVGCACGGYLPPGGTDSDDAYAAHVAFVSACRTEGDRL